MPENRASTGIILCESECKVTVAFAKPLRRIVAILEGAWNIPFAVQNTPDVNVIVPLHIKYQLRIAR